MPRSTIAKEVFSVRWACTELSRFLTKRYGCPLRAEGARCTAAMPDINQLGAWLSPEASSATLLLLRWAIRRISFSRPVRSSGV